MDEIVETGLVMAAYNARQFLPEAIRSIADQDLRDFVCCIVDDGSTDGTADFARELIAGDDRFMVVEGEHGGQAIARNLSVSHLPPTKYLTFPDADDVWHADALRTLVEAAEANGEFGAHALANQIDVDDNPYLPGQHVKWGRGRVITRHLKRSPVPLDQPSTFESLVNRCTVYPPALLLLRRGRFDEINGFDVRF